VQPHRMGLRLHSVTCGRETVGEGMQEATCVMLGQNRQDRVLWAWLSGFRTDCRVQDWAIGLESDGEGRRGQRA
jgi:hypothetical protein